MSADWPADCSAFSRFAIPNPPLVPRPLTTTASHSLLLLPSPSPNPPNPQPTFPNPRPRLCPSAPPPTRPLCHSTHALLKLISKETKKERKRKRLASLALPNLLCPASSCFVH